MSEFSEPCDLNPGYYHEVMDRLHCIMDTINHFVIQHPVCTVHTDIADELHNAISSLHKTYSKVCGLEHQMATDKAFKKYLKIRRKEKKLAKIKKPKKATKGAK